MEGFDKRVDCSKHLAVALQLEQDSVIEKGLLNAFTDACDEDRGEEPPRFAMRLGRWVVRNEDLDLFGTIKDGLLALASSHYAFANLTVSGITSVALAVYKLLRNAYRSGATVSSTQAELLAILKNKGPCSAEQIAGAGSFGGKVWTEQQVRAELTVLTKVATRNDIVAFVGEDANGRWSLRGV